MADLDLAVHLESIAANVRCLRVSLGLTQEQLAEKTGLDYGWLRKLERGKVDLRIRTLVRLSRALLVEPAALLHQARLPPARPGRPRAARASGSRGALLPVRGTS